MFAYRELLRYTSQVIKVRLGALAQLASALPWHGRGHRFESDMLHHLLKLDLSLFYCN